MATLCSDDAQRLLTATTIPYAALSSGTATRLRGCVEGATDCAAAQACFVSDLAAVQGCYSTVLSTCEERAGDIALACGEADRTCEWNAIAYLCDAENNAAMTAAMDCILAESTTSCRTFGDPSGAEACVEAALTPYATTQARDVAAIIEGLCSLGTDAALFGGSPPIAALGSGWIRTLGACLSSAVNCFDAETCLFGLQFDIIACYR